MQRLTISTREKLKRDPSIVRIFKCSHASILPCLYLSIYSPSTSTQDQTESAAILKIKESMQEEAKRFEKDSDHPDYYMQ